MNDLIAFAPAGIAGSLFVIILVLIYLLRDVIIRMLLCLENNTKAIDRLQEVINTWVRDK